MKKKIVLLSSIIASIALVLIIVFTVKTLNSVEYATFKLNMAEKSKDSVKALSFYNVEKIADAQIAKSTEEMASSDNPFAGWGIQLMTSMRPTLISKYEADIKAQYEQESELANVNNVKILFCLLAHKPISADKVTYTYYGPNKVKQTYTTSGSNYTYVWEKINKKWQIVNLEF